MNVIQHERIVAGFERTHSQLVRQMAHLVSQLEDCERAHTEAMDRADRNYAEVIALGERNAMLANNSEYWFAQVNQREETISTLAEDGRALEAQRDQAEASANRWFALAMLSEGVHECKYFSCTEA